MLKNLFTEVTKQPWHPSFQDSLSSCFLGFVLFLISILMLFTNEGQAVSRAKALEAEQRAVISTSSGVIVPAYNQKLIHIIGKAIPVRKVTDPLFGISVEGLKLRRNVAMYQWTEEITSQNLRSFSGSSTVTTYTYAKSWQSAPVHSERFKYKQGHHNPGMPYQTKTFISQGVTCGAFQMSSELIDQINDYQPLPHQKEYFIGKNERRPHIGDMRISFQLAPETIVSVIARQNGKRLEPYTTETGAFSLVRTGALSFAEMFKTEQRESSEGLWEFRVSGFILMIVAFLLMNRLLDDLAAAAPLIDSMNIMGAFRFSLLTATSISLITIALGWIYYRPLAALLTFAIAAIILALMHYVGRRRQIEQAAPKL